MKQTVCFILAAILCCAVFAGCTGGPHPSETPSGGEASLSDKPASGTSGGETPASDKPSSGEDAEKPIDMEAFLAELVEKHPQAGAEALCGEMLKSPYFTLFDLQNVQFYLPGFDYGFKPQGVKDMYAVIDISGEAFVIVFIPGGETDPAAVVKELEEHFDRSDYEGAPDKTLLKEIGGKVFCAQYYGDMVPITVYAEKGRDYTAMFHDYLAKHPDADCLTMARYFASRQKIGRMNEQKAEEGNLRGFGVWDEETGWYKQVEITGFADGARFEPMMEPNAFMGYVFRVRDGVDAETFARTLRENANLAYNVCTSVNTVFTETDGQYVLFVMCNEKK